MIPFTVVKQPTPTQTQTPATTPASAKINLGLTGTGPASVRVKKPLTYTFTITNHGTLTATGVRLTTKLTSGSADLVSAPGCSQTGSLVCEIGNVGAGKTVQVKITVRPRNREPATCRASLTADQVDPVKGNNTETVTTTIT